MARNKQYDSQQVDLFKKRSSLLFAAGLTRYFSMVGEQEYTTVGGETISSLAGEFGISVDELRKANTDVLARFSDDELLPPELFLNIPPQQINITVNEENEVAQSKTNENVSAQNQNQSLTTGNLNDITPGNTQNSNAGTLIVPGNNTVANNGNTNTVSDTEAVNAISDKSNANAGGNANTANNSAVNLNKVENTDVKNTSPAFHADIEIDTELTPEQKKIYKWDKAYAAVRKANPGLGPTKYCIPWTRKQLRLGWDPDTEPAKSIVNDIGYTYITENVFGKEETVLLIRAYSYDQAAIAAINYAGYWRHVDWLYEKPQGVLQQNDSIRAYNNRWFTYNKQLVDSLYAALDNAPEYLDLYTKALNSHKLDYEFIELVKEVQRKLVGTSNEEVTGALNPKTVNAIEAHNAKSLLDAKTKKLQSLISYNDNRLTLIQKLFFISGELPLYQAAIKEEQSAPASKNQLSEAQGFSMVLPKSPEPPAYAALLTSAQNVLFESGQYTPGLPTVETYEAIDNWGIKNKGSESQMDYERLRILSNRSFAAKVPGEAPPSAANQQAYNASVSEFSNRQTYSTSLTRYSQRGSGYVPSSDGTYAAQGNWPIEEYPVTNPFNPNPGYGYGTLALDQMAYGNDDAAGRLMNSYHFMASIAEHSQLNDVKQTTVEQELIKADNDLISLRDAAAKTLGYDKSASFTSWNSSFAIYESTTKNEIRNGYVTTPQKQYSLDKVVLTQKDGVNRAGASEDQFAKFKSDNQWKVEEFDALLSVLKLKQIALATAEDPEERTFVTGLYNFFSTYKGNDLVYYLSLKEHGGVYGYGMLSRLATEMLDWSLLQKVEEYERKNPQFEGKETQAFQTVDAFKKKKESFGTLQAYYMEHGNMNRIPNLFYLDSSYNKNIAEEPRLSAYGPQVQQGVQVDMFWYYDQQTSEYVLYADTGATPFEMRKDASDANYDSSVAVKSLISDFEQTNGLPPGYMDYVLPDNGRETQVFKHHWQWSEVFMWLSVVFALLALPWTGGGSFAWIGYALTALSIGSAITSSIFDWKEKSAKGQLTSSDIITGSLSILASLLPGMKVISKLKFTKGLTMFQDVIGSKAFAITSYTTGIADGVVNGFSLTAEFIQGYQEIEAMSDDDPQKQLLKERLFWVSILYGGLTFHSLHEDLTDLSKELKKKPAKGNDLFDKLKEAGAYSDDTKTEKVAADEEGQDPETAKKRAEDFAKASKNLMLPGEGAAPPVIGAPPGGGGTPGLPSVKTQRLNQPTSVPTAGGWSTKPGAERPPVSVYEINGKKYSKQDFVSNLNNPEFSNVPKEKIKVENGDPEAMDALNKHNEELNKRQASNSGGGGENNKTTTENNDVNKVEENKGGENKNKDKVENNDKVDANENQGKSDKENKETEGDKTTTDKNEKPVNEPDKKPKTPEEVHQEVKDKLTDKTLSDQLLEDLKKSPSLKEAMEKNPELVKGWEIIESYPGLRTDVLHVEEATKLATNPSLGAAGFNTDQLRRLIETQKGLGSPALSGLLTGLNELVSGGTVFANVEKMISELAKGNNFAVGERFILKYIVENPEEFKGLTLTFEETTNLGSGVRRYDLVTSKGERLEFYEFKSTGKIPPEGFADQFMNDMKNKKGKVKWIFDKEKSGDLKVEDFVAALEKKKMKKSELAALGFQNKDQFIEWFENNFNTIFIAK